MADARTCPKCGSGLPTRAPEGLCPRCLAVLSSDALSVGRAGEVGATISLDGSGGVLETIAASLGAVPRVLLRDTDAGFEPPLVRPGREAGADGSTRYRIDGEIARGGMGAVLKGRDPDLGRDVAIKVLRDDLRDNPDMVRRFVEEAQIGGQLQHPGIVPIYELGAFADRRPFFSMKLVKGHTLAGLLADRSHPSDQLPRFLAIFESIAQTVAYAHARGVIHRDLKPSNVMVGSFGEVQVMDWGLAKVLARGGVADDVSAGKPPRDETVIATARSGSGDSDLSHAGSVMGTPSYMAPEQARGEIDRVDERADVFALGSILCKILTGQSAFIGRSSGEIQRKAALGDLADAFQRLDACGGDADLVGMAKDCVAREPEDRPRSAGVVADRVTAYLTGVQEKLRRAELQGVEERGRRRLTTVVAAAVILLGVAGGGAYALNQRQRAERVAKTARAVDEALADAARLRGEAQAAPPGEAGRWAEALSAARRAGGLLAQGEADAPLKGRVDALMAGLEREQAAAAAKARQVEADRVLLAGLESVRGDRAEHLDLNRADAEYAAAFRKAGLDFDESGPAESARWLATHSEPVELAGYLDDWVYLRRRVGRPEADWRRLVAAARAADPDPWRDALRARVAGNDAAASAEYRRLADDEKSLGVQPAMSLVLLARQLRYGPDDRERTARVLRLALSRHPADFWGHYDLGFVWGADSGSIGEFFPRPEESVRHLTAAVAIRPGSPIAHQGLGLALAAQKKLDEAVAECREVIRLRPGFPESHANLGEILLLQGNLDDAVAEYREAIRLKPDVASFRENYGRVLAAHGELDEAIASYREAIRLKPDVANAYNNLADGLKESGDLDAAMRSIGESLRIVPENGTSRSTLAEILLLRGRFAEAVPTLERAAARLAATGEREFAASCEGLVPKARWLAGHVDALKAPTGPDAADGKEMTATDLAARARERGWPALAARLYEVALAVSLIRADDLRAGHRHAAASAAALAGSGDGQDNPRPGDAERAEFRRLARDWLKADLIAWSKRLKADPKSGPDVRKALQTWRQEGDLAGVRDADGLARLPEPERKGWQALWADVDALLQKAETVSK